MARSFSTRRLVLQGAGASALCPALQSHAAAELPSLKVQADAAGLRYGAESDVSIAAAPPEYAALFLAQCGIIAAELSWSAVAQAKGVAEPAWEDPNVTFALRNGLALTGGHLLWHATTPSWFGTIEPGGPAQAVVARHIRDLARHYAGRVYAWNVVNEAIDADDGDQGGLRRSILPEKLGPDWIAAAFRTARMADPAALLVYNETRLEMDTPQHAARRDALLRLLDRLQRDGPIDGVGLQSHLRLDSSAFNPVLYRRFIADLGSRGLKILISELDVLDWRGAPGISTRDADVAARYRDFLAVALAEPAVKAVVTWGLSDRYTWFLDEAEPVFRRPDGLPPRPLPFDSAFQPKPAFFALLGALKQAPYRAPG